MTDKFCVNCRHIVRGQLDERQSTCSHADAVEIATVSLVTGRPMGLKWCWEMRGKNGACGPEGKLYEPASIA